MLRPVISGGFWPLRNGREVKVVKLCRFLLSLSPYKTIHPMKKLVLAINSTTILIFTDKNIVVNPKLRTSLNFGAKNVLLGPSVVNYSGVWPELLAPFAHQ